MYIGFLLTVFCSASGVLSSSINSPCKLNDQSCLDALANNIKPIIFAAIPEFGIESSDPLYVDKIEGDISTFKYKFFNNTLVGYSNCVISNLKISGDITKFQYDMDCPKISMSGKYEMLGELTSLPVEGNGDFEVTTGKYFIHFESKLETAVLDDGKPYLVLKDFKLKCVPQTAIKFDFKNLYNGQKDLSDGFHKLLRENWQEIAELTQYPIWYTCISKVVDNANTYLKHFPIDNFIAN